MDDIREYLGKQDPDYNEGVNLLRLHHKNRTLSSLLQRKENGHNVAKLRYELAKLVGEPALATLPLPLEDAPEPLPLPDSPAELHEEARKIKIQLLGLPIGGQAYEEVIRRYQQVASRLKEVEPPTAPEPDPSLAELAAQLPPEALAEVEAITQQQAQLFREKAQLSNQLGDCENRAQRYELVQAIQAKEEQYNALAEKKQLVIGHGLLPADEPEQPMGEPEQPAELEQPTEAPQPAEEQPAPPAEPPAATVEAVSARLVHERNNLRSNLSKARKKQEAAQSEAKQVEYGQKVQKLTLELEQVELELKGLTQ